jgi:hypothetical protein
MLHRGCLGLGSDPAQEALARAGGNWLLLDAQRQQGEISGEFGEQAAALRASLQVQFGGGGLASRERLQRVKQQVVFRNVVRVHG